ncbi:hypothetical protein PVK06_018983 [Gossypium arboreum]|uniref:Tail specific protease domain-containing protein n=1 Tax=Gossypium arboreum TaxID=29729 RepID=A0ABR0PIQ4_GOSAR|nr:hypothetical protein PVK06_018983 [Gossypium arboreum]
MCGGVLRDSDGVARAFFSGPVVAKDSISAEVGVIIIALDMFSAVGWNGKSSLIIDLRSNEGRVSVGGALILAVL